MLRSISAAGAVFACAGILGGAGGVSAADLEPEGYSYAVPYEGGSAAYEPRAQVYGGPPVGVPQGTPPVYGWVLVRPASCGEFRYWNGEGCVDARQRRPNVGPRW